MGVLLVFAFLSGIITILSPCILPVLPVILAGSVRGGKTRSLGIVSGFIISFTFFTLALTVIVQAFGIPADTLRIVAVVIIVLFGLVLIVPRFHEWFGSIAWKIANLGKTRKLKEPGNSGEKSGIAGYVSGLPVGLSLGLVWTPCVGPIMASVISLALTERLDAGAAFITLSYALGTSIPMLAVMLGGRALLNRVPFLMRNTEKIQKVFGVLMIIVGISIGFGWDRQFQAAVLRIFPQYGTGLTIIETIDPARDALEQRENPGLIMEEKPDFFTPGKQPEDGVPGDYGKAPGIVTGGMWFNTGTLDVQAGDKKSGENLTNGTGFLSMEDLKGRVVLIDFWTYSCVNCIRTIPALQSWYMKYRDQGFVIIGVHTPEFEFEKNPSNVRKAIEDLGIRWPVVLDNEYRQWKAYANRYWPAHYFIDIHGRVRYFHFGEGHYDTSEKVIRKLLKEAGKETGSHISVFDSTYRAKTPETYLGYSRGRGFASAVPPVEDMVTGYQPSRVPGNGEWNLTGRWMIADEYVVPEAEGILQLGFDAQDVFLVIEPEEAGGEIIIGIDEISGPDTPDVKDGVLVPDESRLYHLAGLKEPGPHVLRLDVRGKLRLFAFTFG